MSSETLFALDLQALRYRWPGASADTLVLDSLRLAPGDKVFLRGPSGCGKSTLLSLAAGVLLPQAGQVRLLGQDWAGLRSGARDRWRADHLGYIFQQFNLLPYLSVLDNVRLPLRFSRRRATRSAANGADSAEMLLERSGLPPGLWRQPAGALSVGQQQRVAAARALIGAPELVVADEPTSALDEDLRESFMAQRAVVRQPRPAAGCALRPRHRPAKPEPRCDRPQQRRGVAMSALLGLAARSAWNRRFVLGLVLLSIALSTLLLLGIERLRQDVRQNFSQAVSGTDLIVGARTGQVELLLNSVFRIGSATRNIRYTSLEALAKHRAVAWVLPLSLGDSHRGMAVLGTSVDYFQRFRHGERQPLVLAQGRRFEALFETVIGAEVARALGYRIGQQVVLAHGDGAMETNDHADKPFTVVGILAPTGTPVDRTLHISLQAVEAIHLDWAAGAPLPGQAVSATAAAEADLRPRSVTAALIGLKSRAAVFAVQRDIAAFQDEPLMAILPGVTLDALWELVGVGERGLQAMSALVAVVSLVALVAVIAAGLNERRRELAILRALGAGPRQLLLLLALEGGLVTTLGVLLGLLGCAGAVAALAPWVQSQFGIGLRLQAPGSAEWLWLAALLVGGFGASLVPGWRAYQLSLADGLSPRI